MLQNKKLLILPGTLISGSILVYVFIFQGVSSTINRDIMEGKKVVLLFSASWCGACNRLKPHLKAALQENEELQFYEVGSNLNKLRKKMLFEKYNVHGIPTVVLFKEGKEFKRIKGTQNKKDLLEAFSSLN